MLPLRVDYSYRKLVEAIRAGRLTGDEQQLEDEADNATRWAGYLAHYVQDNTQPHHATLDYKSQTYFPNKRKAPNVHAEVEYRMCDDEKSDFPELRAEYWPLFVAALEAAKDPAGSDDLFRSTLEIAFYSYDALPLIGRAAVAAHRPVPGNKPDEVDTEKFFRFRGTVAGREMSVMEMKAHQQGIAVLRTTRLLRRAWDEARSTPATSPAR